MPHSFSVAGSPPVVIARVDGRVDLIYLQWVLYECVCQGRHKDIRRFLIDFKRSRLDLADVDVYPDARYIASELPAGARVSAVVETPDASLQRFANSLAEAGNVFMKILSSEEKAAEWLYEEAQNAA